MHLEYVYAVIKTFLGLSDTPNSYSGKARQIASVNTGETALTFDGDKDIGADNKLYLSQTNDSYFYYNDSASAVELWVGGAKKASWDNT